MRCQKLHWPGSMGLADAGAVVPSKNTASMKAKDWDHNHADEEILKGPGLSFHTFISSLLFFSMSRDQSVARRLDS